MEGKPSRMPSGDVTSWTIFNWEIIVFFIQGNFVLLRSVFYRSSFALVMYNLTKYSHIVSLYEEHPEPIHCFIKHRIFTWHIKKYLEIYFLSVCCKTTKNVYLYLICLESRFYIKYCEQMLFKTSFFSKKKHLKSHTFMLQLLLSPRNMMDLHTMLASVVTWVKKISL